MAMKVEVSFPDRKISETFLEFPQPLLEAERLPTQEEAEAALKIAFVVWNAVVQNAVSGNTGWVTILHDQVASIPQVAAVTEGMIQRKKTLYSNDLRLVGEYTLEMKNEEWRLRVEARGPSANPG
jgi:hypothetical protein